eukprot:6437324-Prymnesium_polylepis.1
MVVQRAAARLAAARLARWRARRWQWQRAWRCAAAARIACRLPRDGADALRRAAGAARARADEHRMSLRAASECWLGDAGARGDACRRGDAANAFGRCASRGEACGP